MIVELSVIDGEPVEIRRFGDKTLVVKGYVWNDDKTAKRCPTEKCGAYCCSNGALYPNGATPCKFLSAKLSCGIQDKGGVGAKPFGCVMFPRSQADIDSMNKDAIGEHRCHLSIEEI